jgi:hypothetical protein
VPIVFNGGQRRHEVLMQYLSQRSSGYSQRTLVMATASLPEGKAAYGEMVMAKNLYRSSNLLTDYRPVATRD